MRRMLSLATLAAVLVLPGAASAAEIGSSLQGTSFPIGCGTGNDCVLVQDTVGGDGTTNVVQSAGSITGFQVRDASAHSFTFRVLRVQNGAIVGVGGASFTGAGNDVVQNFSLQPPILVQAGDFIGLEVPDPAGVGSRNAPSESTNLLQFSADGAFTPEPGGEFELFLSATFEPDPVSTPVVPPIVPPIQTTATPDPLASLRAGNRPKATIAGGAVTVSKRRVASVRITNPNGYALKGSASMAAGRLKLGKARVALGPGASKAFKFKLSAKAMRRLRKRRKLRATLTAKLKGPIGKAGVTKKKLTLKAPPKPRRKKRRRAGGTPPAASNLWLARNGTTGAYDDFKFKLEGGNINLTGTSLLFVSCFEIGGSYRSSFSYEVFNLLGPWKLGNQDGTQERRSVAVNQLVGSGERTIKYKLTSSRSGDRITGERTMSFSDSSYNPFTNTISFINCSGTQKYEAIPG